MTDTARDVPLVALDANVVDRISRCPDALTHAFIALLAVGRLRLVALPGVAAEMAHPNAPPETRPYAVAEPPAARRPTPRQEIDRMRVRAILRGDGRPGKHDADAAHLSDAAEAGCSFFVTADGKILRKRETLAHALPETLRIVTLADAVAALAIAG